MPAASPTETTREGLFASTRWTMVLDAGESQTPPAEALSALSELCRIYWRPIFLFLRRQGANPHDAQDLTQGFFAHLIESRAYARADPEIPVNIVDLGLVYDCRLSKKEDGGTRVDVKMTLTAPGCGMGPAIAHDAQSKILSIDGIEEADVQLVWDPPWNQNMISEAGRMKLGMV